MIGVTILINLIAYIYLASKPYRVSAVKIVMTDTNHVKYIWQLLVLSKRMDMDPYGLTQAELQTLQSYEMENRPVTTCR